MAIIDRYLLKGLGKSFAYSSLVFLSVFLIAILMGHIETFVERRATFSQITRFFLNQIPFIFVQLIPFAVLLATLFTLGSMSQKNEITALKASGVSLYRICVPILLAALFLSLFSLFIKEFIVPYTNLRFRQILSYEIKKETHSLFDTRSNIAYRGEEGNVYYLDIFDGENKLIQSISILRFDKNGELVGRIDAQKAVYVDQKWQFHNGVERYFKQGTLLKSIPFEQKVIPLKETPDDFNKRQKLPMEMTYRELKQSVEKVKASGGDYKRDQVYLYFTISFPFAAFFMSYIAVPFAIFSSRSNPIINFGICLVIAFLYWCGIAVFHAMGVGGFMPPIMAAWSANILFAIVGTYFYYTAPK